MRRFLVFLTLSLLLLGFDSLGLTKGFRSWIERQSNPLKRKTYKSIGNWQLAIGNWRFSHQELNQLRKRTKDLERKIAELKMENQQLRVDNQAMRKLLGAPLPMEWKFLPAHVLGKTRYLVIDQGRRSQVN